MTSRWAPTLIYGKSRPQVQLEVVSSLPRFEINSLHDITGSFRCAAMHLPSLPHSTEPVLLKCPEECSPHVDLSLRHNGHLAIGTSVCVRVHSIVQRSHLP